MICQKVHKRCKRTFTYFSTMGSGAFFGTGADAGAGANMLAQLFLTPSGMILDVA